MNFPYSLYFKHEQCFLMTALLEYVKLGFGILHSFLSVVLQSKNRWLPNESYSYANIILTLQPKNTHLLVDLQSHLLSFQYSRYYACMHGSEIMSPKVKSLVTDSLLLFWSIPTRSDNILDLSTPDLNYNRLFPIICSIPIWVIRC